MDTIFTVKPEAALCIEESVKVSKAPEQGTYQLAVALHRRLCVHVFMNG